MVVAMSNHSCETCTYSREIKTDNWLLECKLILPPWFMPNKELKTVAPYQWCDLRKWEDNND